MTNIDFHDFSQTGDHSLNQIKDNHLISNDMNRSTARFQDPISVQDDVHSFRMQYSIPGQNPDYCSETEIGRKLNGEKSFVLKLLLSLMKVKQLVVHNSPCENVAIIKRFLWVLWVLPNPQIAGNNIFKKFNDQNFSKPSTRWPISWEISWEFQNGA